MLIRITGSAETIINSAGGSKKMVGGSGTLAQLIGCSTRQEVPIPGNTPTTTNDPIPARTRQKADPNDSRAYAVTVWDTGHPFDPDMSCEDVLPPLLVYSGLYMHLYELDQGDGDDWTASMEYPNVHVPITCQSAWNCTGESAWTAPSSSTGQATADLRVTLETRRLQ